MIQRLCKLSNSHSFFLFGARGSGKSTLLHQVFSPSDTLFIDLLDIKIADELLMDPGRFERIINAPEMKQKRVVIDEIQKFPQLLDTVHLEIQRKKRQFVMTGSSARKLKQAQANMLAGRAWIFNLYPFTSGELAEQFDLKRALELGTLPDAYLSNSYEDSREFLRAYVAIYLEKEIQQERWVRNLEPFRRFLAVASQMNGKIINHSKIAREVGVHEGTVANYYEILEDTLLGFHLPAFNRSVRKAQKQSPKFYLIDTGIKRALDRTLTVELLPQTFAWGDAFEHWVLLEIFKKASYQRLDWKFSYFRTKDNIEIDLIIDRPGNAPPILIEIKSKQTISELDSKNLTRLASDIHRNADCYLFSLDPLESCFGNIRALHWQKGIQVLFPEESA